MFIIYTDKKEVLQDFPKFKKDWFDVVKKKFKKVDKSKWILYYSYGFFIPKTKDKAKYYEEVYELCSNMLFEERFEYELSKVRVNFSIEVGEFILSDRLPKGEIPTIIVDIVREITKVKMTIEGDYHGNEEVIDSIPEIDSNIVSFEIIRDVVSGDYSESNNFDLDDILDKISKMGLDSLSQEEKDFLDKKSKDI